MGEQSTELSDPVRSTGNAELDYILGGGLTPASFYLIEGDPGSGKTTLALEFILEGVRSGEKTLYIALSESEIDLRRIARSHGWELDGVQIVDLTVGEEALSSDEQSTMYHPSEIELGEVTRSILEEVKRSQADRIVIDSVAEIRRLSNSSIRYRRQLMALKSFFRGRKNTVLLLDDRMEAEDLDLQAVARGTITLERRSPDYGRVRRRLQITKMRGQRIHTGYHDFVIESGGLEIFPRMIAWEKAGASEEEVFSSRIDSLDRLLGGGIERGTCTLVMGAAGTGKSSICSQYAVAAAQRGEKAFIWVFDEAAGNFLRRCDGLGLPLRKYREEGLIKLRQVDPAELSPGEFAWAVRNSVEDDGAGLIVIDSLNGYLSSMPDEEYLKGQFHELSTYLNQRGVTTLATMSQHGLVGEGVVSPVETSYLADTIVLLRFFEYAGEVRKAISVVKKRTGGHETAIRELAFDAGGMRIGEPLKEFQGVLTGMPEYRGKGDPLLKSRDHD